MNDPRIVYYRDINFQTTMTVILFISTKFLLIDEEAGFPIPRHRNAMRGHTLDVAKDSSMSVHHPLKGNDGCGSRTDGTT